jgi:hypothetical protein
MPGFRQQENYAFRAIELLFWCHRNRPSGEVKKSTGMIAHAYGMIKLYC